MMQISSKWTAFGLVLLLANGVQTAVAQERANNDLLPTSSSNFQKYQPQAIKTPAKQKYWTEQAAWQQFRTANGKWYAEFDHQNGMPMRAFGTPLQLSGFNGSNQEAVCRAMVSEKLSGFNVDMSQFVFNGVAPTETYDIITFSQVYQNIPVLLSEYTIRLTAAGKVPLFGLRYHAIPSGFATTPTLSEAAIVAAAQQNTLGTVTAAHTDGLRILPVNIGGKYEMHLIQVVQVSGIEPNATPFEYVNWVDANTGTIWSRTNKVCSIHFDKTAETEDGVAQANATLLVRANVVANPLDPAIARSLPYMKVTIAGQNYFTDANGNLPNIPITTPTTVPVRLEGLNAKAYIGTANSVTTANVTVNPNGTLDLTSVGFTPQELAGYYNTSVMKDHFLAMTNNDNALGNAILPVYLDQQGTCNANYNGLGINFFPAGGGCPNTALFDDVVFHEYGHYINAKWAGPLSANNTHPGVQDGAVGEAYADVWAMMKTDNPVLGKGFQTAATSFVRRYDLAPKVYPQDVVNEVHGDGEMLAGSWWDYRVGMNSLPEMRKLYIKATRAYSEGGDLGETFRMVLIEAINADDDDGDLTNGTPHTPQIRAAFAKHGITLLTGFTFAHSPVEAAAANAVIQIDGSFDIYTDYLPYFGAVNVHYKTNTNPVWQNTTAVFTPADGSFAANIPAQPSGTIVYYTLDAADNLNYQTGAIPDKVNLTDPTNSNIPNIILVGFTLKATDNFDNLHLQATGTNFGWTINPNGTDNATTGAWIIAAPVGSPGGVQTGADHTSGPGNTKCLVTGNAAASTDGVGSADVDGGKTTVVSPTFSLSAVSDPAISYYRWFANSRGGSANPGNDPWRAYVSNNNGSTWVPIENTFTDDNTWRFYAFHVADYVTPTAQMKLKFVASDSLIVGANLDGGSLVEGAIDDVQIWANTYVATNKATPTALLVFPNPARDYAIVRLGEYGKGKLQVSLYNMLGQTIITDVVNDVMDYRLDTKGVGSGTYIISVQGEGFAGQQRLQIAR